MERVGILSLAIPEATSFYLPSALVYNFYSTFLDIDERAFVWFYFVFKQIYQLELDFICPIEIATLWMIQ